MILAPDVIRLDILAMDIARSSRPGQFVVILADEKEKPIPLAVIDADASRGTIMVVVHACGPSSRKLGHMAINENIFAVMGPLGKPARIQNYGEVVCAATSVATAQILPICRALKNSGNKVTGVFSSGLGRKILLEPQLRLACHKIITKTQDGLYERRGGVVDVIRDCMTKGQINLVYAVAPVEMLREIYDLTRTKGIKTLVQLNTFISCGTGLCGSCRVRIGGKMALVCQDGPEFDAEEVDFDVLRRRDKAKDSLQVMSSAERQPSETADVISKFFPGLRKMI